jgi:tetratricopeptide (TPR) repeat protein
MDPEDPVAHNNLGVAYLDAGQFEYALGEFRAALRADPGFVAAYNNRGIAYAKTGDMKRAEADLLEAAAKDPQYTPAFHNLAVVYRGLGNAAEARKAEEMLARLKRAIVPAAVPPAPLAIGALRPEVPWAEAERVLGGPPSRQVSVPFSVTPGDELALRVYGSRGLAVAVEKNVVTAIGILERGVAHLPNGVDLGVSADRLRQSFGAPALTEGVRDTSLWVYPDHGLVAFVANGKVNGLWAVVPVAK